MSSIDIGVFEPTSNPTNLSLNLVGAGATASDFSWTGPTTQSRGTLNAGQMILPPYDPDLDGINSYWESLHFGGPTNALPDEDTDGDGEKHLHEFIADTIPTNALSYFQISTITSTGQITISFDSPTARLYGVETSIPLGNDWSALESNLPGVGGPMSVIDTNPAAHTGYRANVRLP